MKKLKIGVIILLGIVVSFFFIMSITHNILLKLESRKIVPNGTLVEINGHKLHIYSEGDIGNKPTLVFMSGSRTPDPVYDFKQLYSLFTDEYRISVIEKIGYGYADIVDTDRDIDIILEESRFALQSVGINGPYVLFPHSMSGLEALYWLSKYPEEITAIIGLDMAIPETYSNFKVANFQEGLLKAIAKIGLTRFYYPFPPDRNVLTVKEYKQAQYLIYRNFMNVTVTKNEELCLFANVEKVKNTNYSSGIGKVLTFSTDGKEMGDYWISINKEFAKRMEGEIIILDCGHYIHLYESQKIAEKSKQYLNKILEQKRNNGITIVTASPPNGG